METLIKARNVNKRYGRQAVLNGVDLEVGRGKIVGLIGHNGAGKTTLLKCILGLSPCEGELEVMGMEPRRQRTRLMEQVCFIADTAILPRWIRVDQVLAFVAAIHPKFNREKAQAFLAKTSIDASKRVSQLSKGMITQLHLALVMAIDVPLLVLDEPTLGLDIVYRKQFYTSLLNDYFDENRTILITTHQVEEIESLLTDLVFIRDGRITLNVPMEELEHRFVQVAVKPEQLDAARSMQPIFEERGLGKTLFTYEQANRETLSTLGELKTPSVADLFVAKMQ